MSTGHSPIRIRSDATAAHVTRVIFVYNNMYIVYIIYNSISVINS